MAKKRSIEGHKLIQATKVDRATHRAFTIICYQSGVEKQDVMRLLVAKFVENARLQRSILRELE